jgi:LPXTG-motif cell wall-anchored protein
MSRRTIFSSIIGAGFLAMMLSVPVGAYDKLTYMTFTGAVQVPGVTLDAGTYQFRIANDTTSRNILQVLSQDGRMVYAMFHTHPDIRMRLTENSVVTFKETPAGMPQAVESLFYGGEYRGYEFVYPKAEPMEAVKIAAQPEITYTPIPVAAVPEAIPEPAPVAEAEPEPAPWPLESEPVTAEPVAVPAAELPKTGSPLPLMALGGLGSLLLGAGARRLRRRLN